MEEARVAQLLSLTDREVIICFEFLIGDPDIIKGSFYFKQTRKYWKLIIVLKDLDAVTVT